MKILSIASCLSLLPLALALQSEASQSTYHVHPIKGNDERGDGSLSNPLKTIAAAQDTIRALRMKQPAAASWSDVDIILHEGNHDLSQSPLVITSRDRGVNFIGAKGEDRPMLTAGVQLNPDSFILDPDTGLLKYDLTQNVNISSLGNLASGQLGNCANNKAEIFVNGEPLWLARYPNIDDDTGLWNWNNITSVCDTSNPCMDSFTWSNTAKASAWSSDTSSDVWLHGYWSFDWADNHIHIESIDAETGTFYADSATPPLYGFLTGARWYAENILQELDTKSEYFIDTNNGFLYLSSDLSDDLGDVVLSIGEHVVSVEADSSNNKFQGLNLGYSQNTIFSAASVTNITIQDCVVSNGGAGGVSFSSSENILVENSTIASVGCQGLSLSGGDRATLTHGKLKASGNTITNYAIWKRTYMAGVSFSGIGIHVLNNDISNSPHQGISGGGNENLFQHNYLHDLCYEASDSGAFYVGRSWSQRGNKVDSNTFENVRPLESTVLGYMEVMGVYLDDQMSGWQVTNNVFINVQQGILVGGGRHNIVENNTFVSCDVAVVLDDRGLTWDTTNCPPGGPFEQDLESFNYQEDPWASRYPLVVNTFSDMPCTPVHNNISNNHYCNCGTFSNFYTGASDTNAIGNNLETDDCDTL